MDERKLLQDEEIKNVSGGIAEADDTVQKGYCPYCAVPMTQVAGGYHCNVCGMSFDFNMVQVK
jgi:hypothetical protein